MAEAPRPERRRNWDAKAKERLRELEPSRKPIRKAVMSAPNRAQLQFIVTGINDAAATTKVAPLRIRILQAPSGDDVDGVDLSHFQVGTEYDMGHPFAEMMVAEGWAEPLPVDAPQPPTAFGPDDPLEMRVLDRSTPPKLVKEQLPTYLAPR